MPNIRFANILLGLVCLGLSTDVLSEHFRIEDEATQLLELGGVERITVRCYCYSEITLKRSLQGPSMLKFIGTLESVGYHGDSEPPKTIERSLMVFDVVAKGGGITIESREWTLMHTAFMIKRLEVVVPPGVELQTDSISFQDLEGRQRR